MNKSRNIVVLTASLLIVLFCINTDTCQMNTLDHGQKPSQDEIIISSVYSTNNSERLSRSDTNIPGQPKNSVEELFSHDKAEYSKNYSEERFVYSSDYDDYSTLSENSYTTEYRKDFKVEHTVNTFVVDITVGEVSPQTDAGNHSIEIVEKK